MDTHEEKPFISFYIPKQLLRENYHYSALLYPIWGVQEMKDKFASTELFRRQNFDPVYYRIVDDGSEADYVLLPYSYWFLMREDPQLVSLYAEEAESLGKPLLIDAIGDSMKEIDIPNSVVLRYASYRKRLRENDIITPVFADDLLIAHREGAFVAREKSEKPTVGFSGWSSFSLFTLPRPYIRNAHLLLLGIFFPYFRACTKGIFLRKKILAILKKSKLIVPNFLERVSYSGNVKTAQGDVVVLREEFVKNILESDYTLCVRGDANQSTRFFEVLSLGRIPLFVDTDIPLPLEDKINYKEFCVFVDYRDISKIDTIVSDFHTQVSPETFKVMQLRAREVFETYMRMDSYTEHLMRVLKEKADSMK